MTQQEINTDIDNDIINKSTPRSILRTKVGAILKKIAAFVVQEVASKAGLNGPVFTGEAKSSHPEWDDNSDRIPTTWWVKNRINEVEVSAGISSVYTDGIGIKGTGVNSLNQVRLGHRAFTAKYYQLSTQNPQHTAFINTGVSGPDGLSYIHTRTAVGTFEFKMTGPIASPALALGGGDWPFVPKFHNVPGISIDTISASDNAGAGTRTVTIKYVNKDYTGTLTDGWSNLVLEILWYGLS